MAAELMQLCSFPGCCIVAELAVRFEPQGKEYFLCEVHGAATRLELNALKKDAEEFREKVKE